MEQVLLVVQVLIAIFLIGMILLQRSDSDGFGLSGGSGNNLLSGRGAANLMTRTTAILAALFIINSLALSIIAARGRAPSIAQAIEAQQKENNAAPVVPIEGLDKTKKDVNAKSEEKPVAKPEVKTQEKDVPAVPTEGDKPVAKKPVAAKKAAATKEQPAPAENDNE